MPLLIDVIKNLKVHEDREDRKVYTDNIILPTKVTDKDKVKVFDKFEGIIDTVFNNMKKRGSYTDFRIDYPWLTI